MIFIGPWYITFCKKNISAHIFVPFMKYSQCKLRKHVMVVIQFIAPEALNLEVQV